MDVRLWEANLKIMLLGLPRFLASKSYHRAHESRRRLVEAFTRYLDGDNLEDAASFIKDLCRLGTTRGINSENIARAQLGSILAFTNNTIPTIFWLLVHVFSDEKLLNQIRSELISVVTPCENDKDGVKEIDLNVSAIRDKCPLLVASYEETLRLTAGNSSIRHTVAETTVGDQWVLEKDRSIQMPTAFLHTDPISWGANAENFRPERFFKNCLTKEESALRTMAFRPFGGGNALCPGRHLVFSEIMAFVGMLFVAFEVQPEDGTGQWTLPRKDKSKIPMSSLKPLGDVRVTIARRKGFEKVRFR